MGVEQNANYKVWNGTDLDIVHFTTKAELVSIKDTNNKFTATDTEGALLELKTEQATHLAEDASLSKRGHIKHGIIETTLNTTWTGTSAPFSKAQAVTGILSTDTPIIDVVMSGTLATDEARLEAWGNIYRAVTSANTITFYATEKPTVSLPLQIKVVG